MEHFPLIVAALTGGLNAAISVYVLWRPQRLSSNNLQKLYEDFDGVATDDSYNLYLNSTRIIKSLTTAVWAVGFLVSVASSISRTVRTESTQVTQAWLTFACWIALSAPLLAMFLESRPVRLFHLALLSASQFLIIACSICLKAGYMAYYPPESTDLPSLSVLEAVQFGAAVVALVLCLLLVRRPELYLQGHAVDGQYTSSLAGRWTFSWANRLLSFAKSNNGLELGDLPKLHLDMRSEHLKEDINRIKPRDQLWKTLLFAHHVEIFHQTLLTVLQAAAQFVPTYALYKFLELFDERSEGQPIGGIGWAWIFGLGLTLILISSIETWLFWILWARLGALIRSELSALIFSKATRRKDVKHVAKLKAPVVAAGDYTTVPDGLLSESVKDDTSVDLAAEEAAAELDDAEQKSRQATINLVTVDTKRVADFATSYYLFPQTATKLVVSIWFLVNLIGWIALLSGFAVFVVVLPLNVYASKVYAKTQGELMTLRDQKMAVITEALQGIRQIKFSALEQQWQSRIRATRGKELTKQWRVFCVNTVLIMIWILGPVMLSAVGLAVYAWLHGDLGPAVAFTTITIFSQIETTLAVIPEVVAEGLEAWVSLKRINNFLNAPEKDEYLQRASQITFWNASIAWPSDNPEPDRFVLRNINLRFPKGKLSVISGQTGSGKSLLLAAIVGEADKVAGRIEVPLPPSSMDRYDFKANKSDWIIDSAVAFVAQICFIENASIRNNIIFGLPYDSGRYKQVLAACALRKDLDMLEDGDNTDIGDKGINLSGGQKWRLSFARAIYSRAGILILDDIFSAVDSNTGRHLYEEALTSDLCQSRTRILVTHHVELVLPRTEYTVVLANGTQQRAGSISDRQGAGVSEAQDDALEDEEGSQEEYMTEAQAQNGGLSETLAEIRPTESTVDDIRLKSKPKKFNEDEKREAGAIKVSVYREYLGTSGGILCWAPILLLFTVYQCLVLGRAWWISFWTRSYESQALLSAIYLPPAATNQPNHSEPLGQGKANVDLPYYLGVYIGISVVICILGTCRYLFVYIGSLRASRILFDKLIHTVLRAPLRWLDTVPVGRILNRFTADFVIVDSKMGNDLGFLLYQIVQVIGIIAAGVFVSPLMLLFALLLLVLCLFVAMHFLAGAREVKRLESNCKSPIFEQFGAVLAGLGTIRAFDKVDIYIERMTVRIDEHAQAYWYLWLFNRWLTMRLNVIGGCFTILVAVVVVSTEGIDASLAGFALSFALQYSNAIIWAIRQYANIELAMNATERIIEYSNVSTEDQGGHDVPAAWPAQGRLDFEGLVAGYAPDLPPVLKGLSFSIAKNERVGVVGRTGAGKSSLTLALFRFLEAREGSISIDYIDISKIRLHDLRSRLAIIPQDPVLFSGTVRSNLDAFREHTDAELFDALGRVHLIRSPLPNSRDDLAGETDENTNRAPDANINIFTSLSSRISEGGLNLSQGQRQLLCLARAIVSRPKVMVLDEATSAVDMATDVLIQRSIREEFRDSTLLVIAHRLSTIADFDKILVISDGQTAEFDTPKALLDRKGIFFDMVKQSGDRRRLEELINRLDNPAESVD